MVDGYRGANAAATDRLRELVVRLSGADLDRPLGEGWTVKAALLHMAFWDRFAGAALDRWSHSGFTPSGEGGGASITVAGLPDWLAAPEEYARSAAIAAAHAMDQIAASLSDALCAAIEVAGESWSLNRNVHRNGHIEQIVQVLTASEPM